MSDARPGLFPREASEIIPGVVLIPDWLSEGEQASLGSRWEEWALPPAGMRHIRMPRGGQMSVGTVCLGRHWLPYRYSDRAEDTDGAPVKPMPPLLVDVARAAIDAARDATGAAWLAKFAGGAYEPDVALVNHYVAGASMGMHRDKDETSVAPVVSLSIGDACVFRFGNLETRTKPYVDIELISGDLVVFGGPARWAYHGVPKVRGGSSPPGCGVDGRLNITIRQSAGPPLKPRQKGPLHE